MYDLIIIGAGPAGITAAIYSARKKLNFIVIGKIVGGQAALSSDVENYTGYQFISGAELANKFYEHMKHYNVEYAEEEVISVEKNQFFKVKTNNSEYESKTVLIASGAKSRMLNIPGENEYKNKGVTYCATCDAPLFAGKDVAVIGGGNSALDAVLQLKSIANKVYSININPEFSGESVMIDKVKSSPKVSVINSAKTVEITGNGKFVSGLKFEKEGKTYEINLQGVFIEVGYAPVTDFIKITEKNKWNEIVINERNETNVTGLYAAGDCSSVPEKQIVVAAGEGSKAALQIFKYLSKQK